MDESPKAKQAKAQEAFFTQLKNYASAKEISKYPALLAKPETEINAFKGVQLAYLDTVSNNVDVVRDLMNTTIGTARLVQTTLYVLNIIMFFLGAGLIIAGAYKGFANTDQAAFGAFIGATGFTGMVSSFLVGSMQRTQKSVSDLANVELVMNNYYEQVGIWTQYVVTGSGGPEDLKTASSTLETITKEMIELLEKYVQEK